MYIHTSIYIYIHEHVAVHLGTSTVYHTALNLIIANAAYVQYRQLSSIQTVLVYTMLVWERGGRAATMLYNTEKTLLTRFTHSSSV